MQYNQAKKIVLSWLEEYLKETNQSNIKFTKRVKVTFKVYKPTRRKTDKSNFYSGASKIIYDALVELGVLIDDNDDYISVETLEETEHNKDNPRLYFKFEEIE